MTSRAQVSVWRTFWARVHIESGPESWRMDDL
jgi:hypothetical protein